jgi:hypothetical protein
MTRRTSRRRSDKSKASVALTAPRVTDLSFLGAPPLIPGESARDYEKLASAVTNIMKPADIMETMWTRDIVDLQWDIKRFRRIKADLITKHYNGSHAYLKTVVGPAEFEADAVGDPSEFETDAVGDPAEFETDAVGDPAEFETDAVDEPAEFETILARQLHNDIASIVAIHINKLDEPKSRGCQSFGGPSIF